MNKVVKIVALVAILAVSLACGGGGAGVSTVDYSTPAPAPSKTDLRFKSADVSQYSLAGKWNACSYLLDNKEVMTSNVREGLLTVSSDGSWDLNMFANDSSGYMVKVNCKNDGIALATFWGVYDNKEMFRFSSFNYILAENCIKIVGTASYADYSSKSVVITLVREGNDPRLKGYYLLKTGRYTTYDGQGYDILTVLAKFEMVINDSTVKQTITEMDSDRTERTNIYTSSYRGGFIYEESPNRDHRNTIGTYSVIGNTLSINITEFDGSKQELVFVKM